MVSQMRDAQKQYFDRRTQTDLRRARYLETIIDTEIMRVKQIVEIEEKERC